MLADVPAIVVKAPDRGAFVGIGGKVKINPVQIGKGKSSGKFKIATKGWW